MSLYVLYIRSSDFTRFSNSRTPITFLHLYPIFNVLRLNSSVLSESWHPSSLLANHVTLRDHFPRRFILLLNSRFIYTCLFFSSGFVYYWRAKENFRMLKSALLSTLVVMSYYRDFFSNLTTSTVQTEKQRTKHTKIIIFTTLQSKLLGHSWFSQFPFLPTSRHYPIP